MFFIAILLTSVIITYYRYIVIQDFVYFTSEEDIPERFNLKGYSL